MSDFVNYNKVNKTRKEHGCACCGRKIEIGESCQNFTGKFEGDFDNFYVCETCDKLSYEFFSGNDDYYDPDFVQEVINDKSYGWECPICGSDRDTFNLDTKKNTVELTCEGSQRHKFTYDLFDLVLENKFTIRNP